MFVRKSDDSPNIYVCGGSKLPEWVLTVDELDELRDSIDLVRPRPVGDGATVIYADGTTAPLEVRDSASVVGVAWRKKDREA